MNDNVLNKIISILNYIIILALLLTSIFLFRQNGILKEELARELIAETTTNTATKTDTIWRTVAIHDTVPKIIKKEKVIERLHTIYIDPILPDDTTTAVVGVPLQVVRKTYEGTTKDSATNTKVSWEANVEGYSLDDEYPRLSRMDVTLEIPQPHTTTTQVTTNTITKRKRWNLQIGAGAGYGVVNKKPDLYVGIQGGYTIF